MWSIVDEVFGVSQKMKILLAVSLIAFAAGGISPTHASSSCSVVLEAQGLLSTKDYPVCVARTKVSLVWSTKPGITCTSEAQPLEFPIVSVLATKPNGNMTAFAPCTEQKRYIGTNPINQLRIAWSHGHISAINWRDDTFYEALPAAGVTSVSASFERLLKLGQLVKVLTYRHGWKLVNTGAPLAQITKVNIH